MSPDGLGALRCVQTMATVAAADSTADGVSSATPVHGSARVGGARSPPKCRKSPSNARRRYVAAQPWKLSAGYLRWNERGAGLHCRSCGWKCGRPPSSTPRSTPARANVEEVLWPYPIALVVAAGGAWGARLACGVTAAGSRRVRAHSGLHSAR